MTDEVIEVFSMTLFVVHSKLGYTQKVFSKNTTILIQSRRNKSFVCAKFTDCQDVTYKNFSTEYSRADILCANYSKLMCGYTIKINDSMLLFGNVRKRVQRYSAIQKTF